MALTWGFCSYGTVPEGSAALCRLCWLVLIMAVRGSTRTRMRAGVGLRRSRVRVCLRTWESWQARILGLAFG